MSARRSTAENLFAWHWLRLHPNVAPVREFRFAPPRRWRFDFAWPEHRIAVEIDGGIWIAGRHNRAHGFEADCTKLNMASALGWRVFRFTPDMLRRDPEGCCRMVGGVESA